MKNTDSDVDDKYDYWNDLFESTVKRNCPIKRRGVPEKDVPYMTSTRKETIGTKGNTPFSLKGTER